MIWPSGIEFIEPSCDEVKRKYQYPLARANALFRCAAFVLQIRQRSSYQGVREVAKRFAIRTAILHLGAARVPAVGPFHLTMTAEEAVLAARAFAGATIVPVHYEGWAHFSEGRGQIEEAFRKAGLSHHLRWAEAGKTMPLVA